MSLLSITTPINIEEEKDKFFSTSNYNPVFKYIWEASEYKTNLSMLRRADLKRAVMKQDYKEIVRCARIYFETEIDPDVLLLAKDIVSKRPDSVNGSVKDLKAAFEKAMSFFDLDMEIILTDQQGFNIRPQATKRRILISKSAELDFFTVDSEVKHEMTHILRFINTRFNNIDYESNYLPTEEGLACYFQDYSSKGGHSSMFQHAAEYVATDIGLRGSFREIFDFFTSIGFSEKLAWQRAIRHKFGFKDTSKSGDFVKPAMYFHHEQEVKGLTEEERWRLFVGKISVESLDSYPKYKGRYPLTQIQEFYNTSFE